MGERPTSWLSSSLMHDEWPALSEPQDETEAQSARALFKRIADDFDYPLVKKHGTRDNPVAMWQERVGSPRYVIPIIGPTADMHVVSRPAEGGGRKARSLLMNILMHGHRPAMVLPQHEHGAFGKRIAIGWNAGSTEARTLHSAMFLLRHAEEVVFLTVGRDMKLGPSAEDMIRYLSHHGVAGRRVDVPVYKDAGVSLVEKAQDVGADVLLCGAYSRGRLQEMIFGGVTEYLLTKADFPVIMMHH